jgi:hypothetical protein
MNKVSEAGKRFNFTATNTKLRDGNLTGILVASSNSGTIKVEDPHGVIVNTMSVSAGQFYPMPCDFRGGLTITVGGTLDATVFYQV